MMIGYDLHVVKNVDLDFFLAFEKIELNRF